MKFENRWPTFAIVLASMLWGADLLLRSAALSSGWSAARVVLGEHVLLTCLFVPILWRGQAQLLTLSKQDWLALLFIAWGGSALATWLYTVAFTLGPPLPAVLMQKAQPVFAIVLAYLILGERRSGVYWIWCALALAGAIMLSGAMHGVSLHDFRVQQAFYALGATALWGSATVAGRWLSGKLTPSVLSGARFALAVPMLCVMLALPAIPASPFQHLGSSWQYAASFLVLIVLLPDLAGMLLYYRGLNGTSASVATIAELCYPLTALLIGVCIQHEHLSLEQVLGLIFLLGSVYALSRKPTIVVAPTQLALEPVESGVS